MILMAAGIVAGGLYLYASNTNSGMSNFPGERGGSTSDQVEAPSLTNPEVPSTGRGGGPGGLHGGGFEEGGFLEGGMERGREGGSLLSWLGVLTQAGKIAVITIVIAVIQIIVKTIRRKHSQTLPQSTSVST